MRRRRWTLNDEVDHHKHGFVAESIVQMDLSFKKRSDTKVIAVASITLDLPNLVKNNLARLDTYHGEKGFRLRFTHDTNDHRIYIQRDSSSPRELIADLPPGAA